MLAWGTVVGPDPGSKTSWRNTPQGWVTIQVLGAVLLVCLGLLLGTAWTTQTLQPNLRQQTKERCRLNEEWSAVHAARRQRGECPRCASRLSELNWYFVPNPAEPSSEPTVITETMWLLGRCQSLLVLAHLRQRGDGVGQRPGQVGQVRIRRGLAQRPSRDITHDIWPA